MSITSQAFGRVTLTEADAEKFTRQVRHGKPKAAAIESVKRGIALSRAFRKTGNLKVKLKAAPVR